MLISYLPLGEPKLHPEQDQEKVGRLLDVAEPFAGDESDGVPEAAWLTVTVTPSVVYEPVQALQRTSR